MGHINWLPLRALGVEDQGGCVMSPVRFLLSSLLLAVRRMNIVSVLTSGL